ncbi:Protein SPR-1 [Aphelenchoides avenae]|nr:Protein SPR-1 [Aphelenchus avenae]
MDANMVHSRETKSSCYEDNCAQLPGPSGTPLPDSAYLDSPDRDELILKVPAPVDDAQMDRFKDYCDTVLTKHGISIDDALQELFQQNWDVRAAEQRFTTVAKEAHGRVDLKYVGLAAYGKRFDRIRLLLPHKPLTELVKHYYDTKKLQFYRKFCSEAGDEDDDAVPEETDVDSSIERSVFAFAVG